MRVLIVDDNFVNRMLLQTSLKKVSAPDIAADGREAIDAVTHALKEGLPYDLILLDIMMPDVDGYEALQKIREIEEKSGIFGLDGVKIIMTTAVGEKEAIMKTFRMGCESYIIKPISKDKLFTEMEKLELLPAKV